MSFEYRTVGNNSVYTYITLKLALTDWLFEGPARKAVLSGKRLMREFKKNLKNIGYIYNLLLF